MRRACWTRKPTGPPHGGWGSRGKRRPWDGWRGTPTPTPQRPNAPPQRPGKGAAGVCVSPCARRGGWGSTGVVLAPALAPPRSADSVVCEWWCPWLPASLSARSDLHMVLGPVRPSPAEARCVPVGDRYCSIRLGRLAVSISRFCRSSRLHRSRWARAAAVMRGSATRFPRLLARAARSSLSSRPMLAAITAVLSWRSGLAGAMGGHSANHTAAAPIKAKPEAGGM